MYFYVEAHGRSEAIQALLAAYVALHSSSLHGLFSLSPFPLFSSLYSLAITTAPAIMPFHIGTVKNRFGNKPCSIKKKKKKGLHYCQTI